MRNGIQAVFEKLRTCGTLAGLPVHLRGIGRRSAVQKANTHVHLPPNFSAFENAAHAVSLAAQQGLVALGASNYYDFEVYGEFAASCLRSRIYPLFGVEIVALLKDLQRTGVLINDPTNPGRMYLCGKGIVRLAPMTAVARDLMGRFRLNDAKRMRLMVDLVRTVFEANNVETDLSEEVIVSRIVNRCGADRESVCLQERHVAQAFQEEFFRRVPPNERMPKLGALLGRQPRAAVDDPLMVQQEIRACLMKAGKPAFVPERFVNFQDAYRLILELGGIPCYPTLADGAEPVCSYEECPEKLVRTLKRLRVFCAEFIPTRNKPEVLVRYVHELRDEGIVVTAGT